MERVRVVFMGTAELACASLRALAESAGVELVAVVTQPDRPRGRGLKVEGSPVKREAERRGLTVWQPGRARDPGFVRQLEDVRPEVVVVAAYGQLLPPAVLEVPQRGCLNVHASLLPRHRGAAPIQWAIALGDTETGVTIMQMDAGLDTGGIVAQRVTPIGAEETGGSLHDRLAALGAALLIEVLPAYAEGRLTPRPQPAEGVTYARKLTREDGRVDWRLGAGELHRRLRAFTPWPGLFTALPRAGDREGRLLKIWRASVVGSTGGPSGTIVRVGPEGIEVACGEEALRLECVQLEGGRRLGAGEFLSGHALLPGQRLPGRGPSAEAEAGAGSGAGL